MSRVQFDPLGGPGSVVSKPFESTMQYGAGATTSRTPVLITSLLAFMLGIVRWEPAPVDVLVVFLLIVALMFPDSMSPRAHLNRELCVLLYCLTTIHFLTISRSPEMMTSLRYELITSLMFVYCLTGYLIARDKRLLKVFLRLFVVGSTITSAIALLSFYSFIPQFSEIVTYGGIRLRGFFKDPNVLAPSSMSAALVALSVVLSPQVREALALRRRWAWICLPILLVAVFLAFSRAAYGGAIVGLSLLLGTLFFRRTAYERKGSKTHSRLGIALAVSGILVAGWLMISFNESTLMSRFGQTGTDDERFATQSIAIEAWKDYPILGHGPITTTLNLGMGTHSLFVQQLYEHGAAGFMVIVLVLVVGAKRAWAAYLKGEEPWIRIVGLTVFCILMGNFATSLLIDSTHWRHFWIFVGIGWGLYSSATTRTGGFSQKS